MEISYSHHLVGLVARAQAAAARVAGADPDRRARLAGEARRRAAQLSARLDGSPITPETLQRVESGGIPVLDAPPDPGTAATGWARALGLDGMETQDVAAVEYANLRAVDAVAEELADTALAAPLKTLRRLHGLVCQGLVAPGVIGVFRQTDQAVHDGTQGMVIFNALAPGRVPEEMAALAQWLGRGSVIVPDVVVAGVVHERLLEIQPFEAGNGRVARAFTRLVLMAGGVDPQGAAVLEEPLWADAGGYYGEVAATMRRRGDLTRWLERHTAALAVALEAAADELTPTPRPSPPERGRVAIADVAPGQTLTLRDYARDVEVDLRTAKADLAVFVKSGDLLEEPGGGGLRFRRPATE